MDGQDLLCDNTPVATKTLEERFWAKVNKLEGEDACWLWMGGRNGKKGNPNGHGVIRDVPENASKMIIASRASWFIHFGKIPDGKFVCHECDNPPCVRPTHLFLGSREQNRQDAVKKGRWKNPIKIGADNEQAKLTVEIVAKIRGLSASGAKGSALARQFGVNKTTISRILLGHTWKHVIQ